MYARPRQRPERFIVNPASTIAEAMFVALGPNERGSPGTTDYEDSSFYGSHGVLTGYSGAGDTPGERWAWDATLRRPVLSFDGSNDCVTVDAAKTVLGVPSSHTISLWVYRYTSANRVGLVGRVDPNSPWNGYFSSFGGSGVETTDIGYYNDKVGWWDTNAGISAGGWHHIAVVLRAGVGGEFFIDGSSVYSYPTANCIPAVASSPFVIGGDGGTGQYFDGMMADVSLYGRALLSGEIFDLAQPDNYMLEIGGVPGILPVRQSWRWAPVSGGAPTADVSPIVVVLSTRQVTAGYLEVDSAAVAPVETVAQTTEAAADYQAVLSAEVAPIVVEIGTPAVTATLLAGGTASVDPIDVVVGTPDVAAGYAEVDEAQVLPVDVTVGTVAVNASVPGSFLAAWIRPQPRTIGGGVI